MCSCRSAVAACSARGTAVRRLSDKSSSVRCLSHALSPRASAKPRRPLPFNLSLCIQRTHHFRQMRGACALCRCCSLTRSEPVMVISDISSMPKQQTFCRQDVAYQQHTHAMFSVKTTADTCESLSICAGAAKGRQLLQGQLTPSCGSPVVMSWLSMQPATLL